MNDLRRIFRNQLRAVVCLVALGGLVHLQVAAEVADPAFNRFRSQVVGNSVNFSYGAGGTPLGGASNATGIGVTSGIDVGRAVSLNTKHGPIAGTLKQKISNAAMGKAFARAGAIVGGPVGLAFLALPVIVDWMQDAGVRHEDGQFEKPDPASCTASCYTYTGSAGPTPISSPSIGGFCAAYQAAANALPRPMHRHQLQSLDVPNHRCYFKRTFVSAAGEDGASDFAYVTPAKTSRAPDPDAWVPATTQDVEDRMSMVTPSPEALAELYRLGEFHMPAHPVPDLVDTLRADFESRSPESTETTTSESPAETKTEQKTCATYTQLSGSTVGLVEQCTTTTTTQAKDPETGAPVGDPKVETSTKTNTTPDPATKEEAADPCADAPDRAMCVKLGTATGEIPTATRSVSYTPEILFGSGTCPPDQTISVYGMSLKLTDMPKACNLLATYVKPIAILLAAFSALMIVAVGVPE